MVDDFGGLVDAGTVMLFTTFVAWQAFAMPVTPPLLPLFFAVPVKVATPPLTLTLKP